uniref:Uncharacterized protein n=1 Tax=Rhizophora mucronata TaxID=61149 RepID=A0A2P2IJG4_RHIMU
MLHCLFLPLSTKWSRNTRKLRLILVILVSDRQLL